MGKAEDKRAAIVAAQAAREAAERAARAALGPSAVPARKRRTNWAASAPMRGPGRGPQKPPPAIADSGARYLLPRAARVCSYFF